MASAARTPMIATTIISSTSVKPPREYRLKALIQASPFSPELGTHIHRRLRRQHEVRPERGPDPNFQTLLMVQHLTALNARDRRGATPSRPPRRPGSSARSTRALRTPR